MALETPLPGGSLALHPHPLPSTAFALPAGTLLWVSDTVFECVSTSGRVLYLSPHPTRSPAFLLSASDGSYAVTFTAASILPLALTDINDVHYIHTGIHLSDTSRISLPDTLAIARHVAPHLRWELATADHVRLHGFRTAVNYLSAFRVAHAHQHERTHPTTDSPDVTSNLEERCHKFEEALASMGLNPTQIDLAVRLSSAGLHPRVMWQAVQLLAG